MTVLLYIGARIAGGILLIGAVSAATLINDGTPGETSAEQRWKKAVAVTMALFGAALLLLG
jgi:hypothetical protein